MQAKLPLFKFKSQNVRKSKSHFVRPLDIKELTGDMWIVRRHRRDPPSTGDTSPQSTEASETPDEGFVHVKEYYPELQETVNPCAYTDLFLVNMPGEPIQMDIDISTGHLILSYMEEHLNDKDRLDADWKAISEYEADDMVICEAALRKENESKNRNNCSLPYEQSRIKLRSHGDYINASLLYDHEPRNPNYLATITPRASTVNDFWQMVWEQSSVVIVCLDSPAVLQEAASDVLASDVPVRYWPAEGAELFGNFEVHLVSEHSSSADYTVRSFYLKQVDSNETRTVTQFQLAHWTEQNPAEMVKPMLEFRRKVNKSFRGKYSPVLIHCIDGCGLTGTYLLLDLVLNRISRGLKELDIAASLEHLRDQRQRLVNTKEQFEFVLTAIADEVNSLLKAHAC